MLRPPPWHVGEEQVTSPMVDTALRAPINARTNQCLFQTCFWGGIPPKLENFPPPKKIYACVRV